MHRDVAIIFLAHLMRPAAFAADACRRSGVDSTSLSRWSFPLSSLAAAEADRHTEKVWSSTLGKAGPFEIYKYAPDGRMDGLLAGAWAAKATITCWHSKSSSKRSSWQSLPSLLDPSLDRRSMVCDLSVWAKVRTGSIEQSWTRLDDANERGHSTRESIKPTRTFQLGKRWDTRLQSQAATIPESRPFQQSNWRESKRFSRMVDTHSRRTDENTFPCISTDLIAAVKRLKAFADSADQTLKASTSSAKDMIDRFHKFLALVEHQLHDDDVPDATSETEAKRQSERMDTDQLTQRKVVHTTLVPPLDVDIVWRVALLSPSRYQSYTAECLGGLLDHHFDTLESSDALEGRRLADQAWSAAYPGQQGLRPRRVTNP
jgi:hypothetical protein